VGLFGDAVDINPADALDAAFAGIALRRRPAQDHLIPALCAGQLFSPLWNSLDRGQRRSSFPAGWRHGQRRDRKDQKQMAGG
jgi:hypothetical protein